MDTHEKIENFNETAKVLYNKIMDKSARIGVVGLGYVGLPLAVEKAKAEHISEATIS